MSKNFRWRGDCSPTEAMDMTAKLYKDGWDNISCEQTGNGFLILATRQDSMDRLRELSQHQHERLKRW